MVDLVEVHRWNLWERNWRADEMVDLVEVHRWKSCGAIWRADAMAGLGGMHCWDLQGCGLSSGRNGWFEGNAPQKIECVDFTKRWEW